MKWSIEKTAHAEDKTTIDGPSPISVYSERLKRYWEHGQKLEDECRRLGMARILLFLIALSMAASSVALTGRWEEAVYLAVFATLAAFLVCVYLHNKKKEQLRRVRLRAKANEEGIARVKRSWTTLPEVQTGTLLTSPKARDLDIIGSNSLVQLISHARSSLGRKILTEWLVKPAGQEELLLRQEAIRELAPLLSLREDLYVEGQRKGARAGRRSRNRHTTDTTITSSTVTLLALALPLLNITMLATSVIFALHSFWIVLTIVLTSTVAAAVTKESEGLYQRLESECDEGELLHRLTAITRGVEVKAPKTVELLSSLDSAEQGLKELDTVTSLIGIRRSGLYPILHIVMLWNVFAYSRALRWRERWGEVFPQWLVSFGELEALLSLSSLIHDNPTWCLPTFMVQADGPLLEASALGHPLLPQEGCVRNDITISKESPLIILTGSNMSGKSTFLRSIGVNVSLALAGGPVCAERFTLSPLTIATSMRVSDSLAEGRSLYLAELLQLKEVIALAKEEHSKGGSVLFLFDEILHGTNSHERGLAVRRVVTKLLELGAVGCVTTHDISLGSPSDNWIPTPHYFTETLSESEDGLVMTFDYVLREGIAPTTNGLALMEAIGLDA